MDADADFFHRLLPQLVELAIAGGRRRGISPDQRFAAGPVAIAVAAFLEAEIVEELVGKRGIVGNAGAIRGVVAHDIGWDRILSVDRLVFADHANELGVIEGHQYRPPQGDLFLAETAEFGIGGVDVGVIDVRIGDAAQGHALLRQFRTDFVVRDRDLGELLAHVQDIQLVFLKREPRRLLLFDDVDLDPPDLRHLLAFHRRGDLDVAWVAAGFGLPYESSKIRVGFEDDLVRALPFLEAIGAGSNRVSIGVVGVGVDDLARDRAVVRHGHEISEVVVGLLELDLQRISVQRLQSVDPGVVIHPAAFFGVFLELLESHDAIDEAFEGRLVGGILEALDRVDVILRGQLALLALERGVRGKVNPLADLEDIGPGLIAYHRHGFRRARNKLRRTRQIVVGHQRVEDRLVDGMRIVILDFHRVETGFGDVEFDAQHLVRIRRLSASARQHERHGDPASIARCLARDSGRRGKARWYTGASLVLPIGHCETA